MPSYFPELVLAMEGQNNSFRDNQDKAKGLLMKSGAFCLNELSSGAIPNPQH